MEYEDSFNIYKDISAKKPTKNPSFKPRQYNIQQELPKNIGALELSEKERLELYDVVLDYIIPTNIDPNIKSLSKVAGAFILDDLLSNYFKK